VEKLISTASRAQLLPGPSPHMQSIQTTQSFKWIILRAIESDSHGRGKDEWKQYAKGCSSCYRETGKASRPGSGPGSWDALSSTTTTAISRLIGAQIGVKRAEITGKGQRREHYFSTDLKRNIFWHFFWCHSPFGSCPALILAIESGDTEGSSRQAVRRSVRKGRGDGSGLQLA